MRYERSFDAFHGKNLYRLNEAQKFEGMLARDSQFTLISIVRRFVLAGKINSIFLLAQILNSGIIFALLFAAYFTPFKYPISAPPNLHPDPASVQRSSARTGFYPFPVTPFGLHNSRRLRGYFPRG